MFNTKVPNNGVNEAGVYIEGLSPGRCRPVVIKLLSKKSGRLKIAFV